MAVTRAATERPEGSLRPVIMRKRSTRPLALATPSGAASLRRELGAQAQGLTAAPGLDLVGVALGSARE